jgi:2-hydroxychromene-2-carboxylate isomerase
MQIENIARLHSVSLVWKPFLLGPIFKQQGWHDSPFNLYPAKGRYMWRDMQRLCEEQGLPYQRPSEFPRNGLLASRVACHHQNQDWLPEFVRNVFSANFEKDLDISSKRVIADCLPLSAHDANATLINAESDQVKRQLRANTDQATKLGIFGAPTFSVGEELFWGGDRLESAFKMASLY